MGSRGSYRDRTNRTRLAYVDMGYRRIAQGSHTLSTPNPETILLGSIVTLISVQIAKAKGTLDMVQAQLPGMPRIVDPSFRPVVEYVVEPLSASSDGFRIATSDGHVVAILSPMGEGVVFETNVMLIQAIVETFNTVQGEIMRDG